VVRRNAFCALFLCGLAFLLHLPFVSAAPGIVNNDYANANYPLFGLLSDYLRAGHWTPYTFGLGYGGTYVATVRALWQSVWFVFTPETAVSHLQSSYVFTYALLPAVFTGFVFYLCLAYTGLLASCLVALFVAVDFQSNLMELYGSDYYLGYIIPGCILFFMRARLSNPFRELSLSKLFFAALVTGIGVYLCRAAEIYAVAFWIPWEDVWRFLKTAFNPRSKVLRIVLVIFWILAALGIYLEIFGSDLGQVAGKHIILDAGPNWDIVVFLVLILCGKVLIPRLTQDDWKRIGLMGTAVSIGIFPELWQQIVNEHHFPHLGSTTYSQTFDKSVWVIGQLPARFRSLVASDPHSSAAVASVLLGLAALVAIIDRCRKDRRFLAVAVSGVLAVFAFIRIRTYNSEGAPLRYFLPILPCLYLGYAALFDTWLFSPLCRRRVTLVVLLSCLTVVHLVTQYSAHIRSSREILATGEIDRAWDVVREFQASGVSLVYLDDYLASLQYSFFAQGNPLFAFTTASVEPFSIVDRAKEVGKIGYIAPTEIGSLPERVTIRGRSWRIERLFEKVGSLYLYLGQENQ
jgi:hypothetical protein